MKTNLFRRFLFAICLVFLLFSFIPGCTPPQTGEIGFNPMLSISEPPALGKPVKVTLTFTAPNIRGPKGEDMYYLASIELLPGVFELVDGTLEIKGRIVPGETHTLTVTVKSIRTMRGATIYGRVAANPSPDDTRTTGDEDILFVTITEDGASISETQPRGPGASYIHEAPTIVGHDEPCELQATLLPSGSGASSPQRPEWGFKPVLLMSDPPTIGKPVNLSLSFTSPVLKGLEGKERYYYATIEVPGRTFELVEGGLTLKGRVVRGE